MNTTTTERAIFASGCFWGTEYFFQQEKGVLKTTVGYTGGEKENPSYQDVCSGRTGHAEATEVIYDPAQTSFEVLAKLFFETHNPGQKNRQGPDIGTQYRSAVFYLTEDQKEITERLIRELKEKKYDVVTEVTGASVFWKAEDKHQQYYTERGGSPYCHRYSKKF